MPSSAGRTGGRGGRVGGRVRAWGDCMLQGARRVSTDQFLRNNRFRIRARPADGAPVWERDGREYSEAQALVVAHREWKEALESVETGGKK